MSDKLLPKEPTTEPSRCPNCGYSLIDHEPWQCRSPQGRTGDEHFTFEPPDSGPGPFKVGEHFERRGQWFRVVVADEHEMRAEKVEAP